MILPVLDDSGRRVAQCCSGAIAFQERLGAVRRGSTKPAAFQRHAIPFAGNAGQSSRMAPLSGRNFDPTLQKDAGFESCRGVTPGFQIQLALRS